MAIAPLVTAAALTLLTLTPAHAGCGFDGNMPCGTAQPSKSAVTVTATKTKPRRCRLVDISGGAFDACAETPWMNVVTDCAPMIGPPVYVERCD